MKRYDKYKPTRIDWIGEIPSHWDIKKLKYIALVRPSNVDKKTNEGELPILLCNYVDVYKNEFIDSSIKFMEATATENEIEKFGIEKGDVLVTKDSETPEDIANPALVSTDFENVLCAYHLTQIRPNRRILLGEYLFRLFQEDKFNSQFEVAANGITRYGLSVSAFTGAFIILPPLPEQTAIANYLDEKTAQIDSLIAQKQKLIELLKEERTAIINEAVSGEGKNWERKKLKYVMDCFDSIRIPLNADQRSEGDKIYDYYGASGVIDKVPEYLFDGEYILIGEDGANLLTRSTALAFKAKGKFWVNNHAHILKPKGGDIDFYTYLLESLDYSVWVTGSAQPKLTAEKLLNIDLNVPSHQEQQEITNYLQTETQRIDNTILKVEKEINLLQEYRTALVSEVVTGKIKVI